MRTLNAEEVKEVNEILTSRHPLYYGGLKLKDIIPCFKYIPWFDKQGGEPISSGETEQILGQDYERSDEVNNSADTDTKKSMHILGFGTIAYLDFHRYLMILYALIVVLLLPSLTIFLFYGDGRRTGSSLFTQFTLANIGFTSALCKDVTLEVGNLTLTCPTGQIGEIVSFGIIPAEGKINDACLPNEETKMCDEVYDQEQAKLAIEKVCLGKPYCTINTLKLLASQGPEDCLSKYAQFYTQVF